MDRNLEAHTALSRVQEALLALWAARRSMAGNMLHAAGPRCTCWTASAPVLLSLHLERLADRGGPAQAVRRPLSAVHVRKLKARCQLCYVAPAPELKKVL